MVCGGTLASLATGLVLAAYRPVVIVTDAPFPADTFIDSAAVITGFERDLMDEVRARAVLDRTWDLANFQDLIPDIGRDGTLALLENRWFE